MLLKYSKNKSQHMVDSLAKYNIVPRKCKIISFPYNSFSENLYRHVIRGVFDGDGCISGRACSFAGNGILIPQVQALLHETLSINLTKLQEKKNGVWSFSFSSKSDVTEFYHYLYDNATIYLSRKKDRFEKLPYIFADCLIIN